MRICDLLAKECVLIDVDAKSKEEVWRILSKRLYENGVVYDVEAYLNDIKKRELQGTTGVGFGVAIPHAKSEAVIKPALAFARIKGSIDVESLDGSKADLFFQIAAPVNGQDIHLHALSRLARMLVHESFLEALRSAKTVEGIMGVIAAQEE